MGEFGRLPGFEPDENVRRMIEELFAEKKEARKDEVVEEAPTEDTPKPTRRVRLPEPPAQTKKEQGVALGFANQEIELLHEAFLEFSERTSDLVIYGHLYAEILTLTEVFQDMEALINQTIHEEALTEQTAGDYNKLKKIRARILSDVYGKYKKNE